MISAIEQERPECLKFLLRWWEDDNYIRAAAYVHGAAIFSDEEVFAELSWLVSILSVKDSLATISEVE